MAGFDAFAAAQDTVDDIESLVSARIWDAQDAADAAKAIALDTIDDLKGTKFSLPEQPPAPPKVDAKITITNNINAPNASDFGGITAPDDREVSSLVTVPTMSTVAVPTFTPSITRLVIPDAPVWEDPDAPDEQTFDLSPTMPGVPNIGALMPVLGNLATITIPEFVFPTLPTFDATAPEFEGSALPPTFEWAEPTYATEILDEAMVVIRTMFAGGTGLPPAIENALFERMNDREDRMVARAVSEVYTEWSDRGFTAPNGMTNARIDSIRQDGLLKKQGANRELTIEFAKIEVENLKFAVTQALAAEQVLVNIFLNSAERMFQAAKYQVQALVEIYNAQVALFNARQVAYQTAANVYKTRVEAAISEVEVYKSRIQGELAKAQVNESIVRAYTARVQSLMAYVEIYKGQLEGVKAEVAVTQGKIEAYKATIEAYASRVNAQKVKFDAYSARVQGEGFKANIVETEAKAYAAQIQGISTKVSAEKTGVDAAIATNEIKIKEFLANMELDKTLMQNQLAGIQQAVAAYQADTQRYIAQSSAEKDKAQLEIAATELKSRTAISLYSAVSAAYNARMEQLIREASLTVEGLKSAGQIATTLAASAYAAVHVGATLSGGGNMSASGSVSDSYSRSDSTSTNTNYNYEGT